MTQTIKKDVITIRNMSFKVSELERMITPKVLEKVKEYKKDPNCWADLWISDSDLDTPEQIAFIYLINHKKEEAGLITFKKSSNKNFEGRAWYKAYQNDKPVIEQGQHLAYHAIDEKHALAMHSQVKGLK